MMKNFIVKEFTDPSSTEYRSEYKFLPQGIIAEFPATSPFVGTLKSLRALYSTS